MSRKRKVSRRGGGGSVNDESIYTHAHAHTQLSQEGKATGTRRGVFRTDLKADVELE